MRESYLIGWLRLLLITMAVFWNVPSQGASSVPDPASKVQRLMLDAFRYYTGTGRQLNYPQALRLYRKAAMLGDPEAQFILGGMFFRGIGTDPDHREAFRWFLRAAEQGRSTPMSLAILGASYLRGQGVPQNYKEAYRWHSLAAEQGNRQARNELAYMYYNGLGIKQDFTEAAKWYKEAALQGDPQAQFNLGVMFFSGLGVAPSRQMAYAWYSIAAGNGNTTAILARNALLPRMSWEELNQAQAESMALFRQIEALREQTPPSADAIILPASP